MRVDIREIPYTVGGMFIGLAVGGTFAPAFWDWALSLRVESWAIFGIVCWSLLGVLFVATRGKRRCE